MCATCEDYAAETDDTKSSHLVYRMLYELSERVRDEPDTDQPFSTDMGIMLGPCGPVLSSFPTYMVQARYIDRVLATLVSVTRRNDIQFDTLIGTGVSGAAVVPLLGDALKLNWAIVRKKTDTTSHSGDYWNVVGTIGSRWLFVDDVMASGQTLCHVQAAVHEICKPRSVSFWDNDYKGFREILPPRHNTEFVGTFLYESGVFKLPGYDPFKE